MTAWATLGAVACIILAIAADGSEPRLRVAWACMVLAFLGLPALLAL